MVYPQADIMNRRGEDILSPKLQALVDSSVPSSLEECNKDMEEKLLKKEEEIIKLENDIGKLKVQQKEMEEESITLKKDLDTAKMNAKCMMENNLEKEERGRNEMDEMKKSLEACNKELEEHLSTKEEQFQKLQKAQTKRLLSRRINLTKRRMKLK